MVENLSNLGQVGLAYIYCDYRDQTKQTVVNIMGSLLQQLLFATSPIPNEVQKRLELIQGHGKAVEIGDIAEMLKITLSHFHHIFICIDALDELEPRTRLGLLASLGTEFRTARVFLTGRPTVQHYINHSLKTQQANAINITPNQDDIKSFLLNEIQVDKNISPDTMNSKLEVEILSTIIAGSKGM